MYIKKNDMMKKSYFFSGCIIIDFGLLVFDIKINVLFGDLSRSIDRVFWKKLVK